MYYVLTEAEGQDGFLTGRMRENFIGSSQLIFLVQMWQYSVALKNDPLCRFLANNVWVYNSRDGIQVQNEVKLHNLKIAVDIQNLG